MRVTAAQGMARILKMEGVPWVSTFPVCNVNNAFGEEGIELLMMREERYAVAVADAFSRVTGGDQIGVCTVMGGMNPAGLQIAYGALAQAYEDSSPVLCISDGLPPGIQGLRRYDIKDGFRGVTKWVGQIDLPHRVPEFMRRAFTYLRTGRPGPVLLTLPAGLGEYEEEQYPYTPVRGWRWSPDPRDVASAIEALVAAKSPLLYVGEGVLYAGATDELKAFVEMANLPVLTSLKAKSAFPENHPLSVGVRGEPATRFLNDCDLLFVVGSSLSAGHFRHQVPDAREKVIVQCTLDPMDLNATYAIDHAVVGDAKLALKALTDELAWHADISDNERAQQVRERVAAAREELSAKYGPLMRSDEKPINPYRVYGDLMDVIDLENSFVTHDSGNTRDQLSTVYEAIIPRGFLGWGTVSTLGFGLAAAVAAKLAYPGRQCVNVTGDAGVGYMMGNLEALVRNEIGVTTVHINNGGFAGYGPGFWGPGHDPYTCEVLDHSVASMGEVVEAMGYQAETVHEPSAVVPALERALEANANGRPAYVEIICSCHPVYGEWVKTG